MIRNNELVVDLIERGANVNFWSNVCAPPLLLAARFGEREIFDTLIQNRASPFIECRGGLLSDLFKRENWRIIFEAGYFFKQKHPGTKYIDLTTEIFMKLNKNIERIKKIVFAFSVSVILWGCDTETSKKTQEDVKIPYREIISKAIKDENNKREERIGKNTELKELMRVIKDKMAECEMGIIKDKPIFLFETRPVPMRYDLNLPVSEKQNIKIATHDRKKIEEYCYREISLVDGKHRLFTSTSNLVHYRAVVSVLMGDCNVENNGLTCLKENTSNRSKNLDDWFIGLPPLRPWTEKPQNNDLIIPPPAILDVLVDIEEGRYCVNLEKNNSETLTETISGDISIKGSSSGVGVGKQQTLSKQNGERRIFNSEECREKLYSKKMK